MGDVCRVVGGSTPDTNVSDYWGGDIPWLTPEDLARDHSQYVSEGRRNITEQGYVSCSTQLVPAGTILFTSRAPIGYVAIARQPVCTNQGFKSFVLPAGISSKYLYWYLRWATPLIRKMGSGTTFAEISGKVAKTVPLLLAPGPEQERIASAIEEQLSRVDVSESLVRRARHNSVLMRAAVLTDALRGDWPSKRLGDVAEVFVGTTPARSNAALWNGGVPWVSSGEVAFCRIKRTHETISPSATRTNRVHPPGTVLLAMIGEGKTRGQAAILNIEAAHNQNSAAIHLDPAFARPEWLFYLLMQRYAETRSVSSGNNQPALNKARVQSIEIPLPSLDQQDRIVADLDVSLSVLERFMTTIDDTLARSAQLRHAILGRAFSGLLVPQDPADEPAERLLARIARQHHGASRATQNGGGDD
jgi:type I restriction enzyme S subunit